MRSKRLTTSLCLLPAFLLAACGGGGGSSSNSAPPAPTQNLQSVASPAQPWSISSTTLTGTDSSGNSWTATYSSAPSGSGTFNGQVANTSTVSLTVSENGAVVSTEDSTAYYLVSPYSPLGLSGTTNGVAWTAIVTSFTAFPSTLTVGSSGPVLAANYEDSMGNVIGGLTETYTVTADSPTALFLNIDAAGTINGTQVTETLTYAIASDGSAPTLAQAQITVNGTTLTFQ